MEIMMNVMLKSNWQLGKMQGEQTLEKFLWLRMGLMAMKSPRMLCSVMVVASLRRRMLWRRGRSRISPTTRPRT